MASFIIGGDIFAVTVSLAVSPGGFKNQPQQLMFGSGFSEFHIEQQLAVNLYR